MAEKMTATQLEALRRPLEIFVLEIWGEAEWWYTYEQVIESVHKFLDRFKEQEGNG